MPNFHSHYVLCRIDGNPIPHTMIDDPEPYYDEIVIEQESAVVPFYLLKIQKNNLLPLALEIQKRQEKLRQMDETTRSSTIRISEKGGELSDSRRIKVLNDDEVPAIKDSRKFNIQDDLKDSKRKKKGSSSEEELEYTRIK